MNPIPDVPKEKRKYSNCGVSGPPCTGGDCPCPLWTELPAVLKARAEKIIAAMRERAEKAEAMLKGQTDRLTLAADEVERRGKTIKLLKADLRRWEEESACLPEDRSIGEFVEYLRKQVKLLREALEAMLEPQDEECWYDHHGHCQAHHMRINDAGDPECEVPLARKALAETEDKGEKP